MKLVVPFVFFLLSGCVMNPDVAMKLEQSPTDFRIMMGEFNGSLALIHGSPKNATISATDGEFGCEGVSSSGKFKNDMYKNVVTHLFNLTCDNGTTGQVILKITLRSNGIAYGAGVGQMNDGSKLKIVVGEMSGTLAW